MPAQDAQQLPNNAIRHRYLMGNSLGGSLPSELGQMTSLESVYLESNSFIGSIPSELGRLTNANIL